MLNNIQTTFGLSENQCRLVIIYFTAFIVQSMALLVLSPKKFRPKIFVTLLAMNIFYNIMWMKFFSE